MPDYEALYPSRFLKGVTLQAPRVIKILSVNATDLEGEDGVKAKCVLKYRDAGGEGEIVWCKTNAALTAAMLGRDIEAWIGHYITIHFDPSVKMGPDTVGGIRVFGSPELKGRKRVEIKRPRRKRPEVYVLEPTDGQGRVRGSDTGRAGKAPAACDGQHAEPRCADPACYLVGPPEPGAEEC